MAFARLLPSFALLALLASGCATGNRVLNLNGRSEYGHLADQPALRLAQGDFSVTGWVQVRSFGKTNNGILSKRGTGNSNGWTYFVAGSDWPDFNQKIVFHVSQGDNPFTVSKTPLQAGEWYHLAAVYQAASRRMTIYIDGKEDVVGENMTTPNPLTTASLYIGRDSVYPRYFFNGMMDDLAVWQRALTAADVRQVMAAELTGTEPGLLALWDFNQGDLQDRTGHGYNGDFVDLDQPLP